MTEQPSQIGFGHAVVLTFRTALKHWRTCLGISAAYAVLSGLVDAVSRGSTGSLDPTVLEPAEVAAAGVEAILALVALILVNVIVWPVTLGALSLVGSAAVWEDRIDTRGVVRRALDRSMDAIAVTLATLLLLIIPLLIFGVLAVLLAFVSSTLGFTVILSAVFLGAVPALYLFVRFSLAIPVVMRERRGPIDALKRSWQLVGGSWWWVFGVGVVVAFVVAGLGTVFSVQSFFGEDSTGDYIAGFVRSAIVGAVGTTLFGVASGVVYTRLVPEGTPPPEVLASEARAAEAYEPPL